MSEKTRAELKEQIKIMNHNYQVIREMHEKGYQYSIGEIKRLQDDLERTRKALDVAVDALDTVRQYYRGTAVVRPHNIAAYCDNKIDEIKEITTLKQKDGK